MQMIIAKACHRFHCNKLQRNRHDLSPNVVTLPGKYISTQHTANNVPQMWYIVYIWQGTGNKNVLLSLYGKTAKTNNKKTMREVNAPFVEKTGLAPGRGANCSVRGFCKSLIVSEVIPAPFS